MSRFAGAALGIAAGLASLAGAPSPAAAQEWRDFRSARQVGSIESLDIELLYGAGHLSVGAAEAPFLYDARLRYDTHRFQPVRGWSRDDGMGRLRLALTSADDDSGETVRLEDRGLDLDFEDLRRHGDGMGTLEFRLAPGIPTNLRLGAGAAESRLELGGLSLTSLELLTGAGKTRMSFASPNRVDMRTLTLRAGAAELEAEGLGNARFDRLEFAGAIGDVTLDFSGDWERDGTAAIKMGVGELTLRVPSDLGVRIERSSLLISLDAEGFDRVEGGYVSPNWDSAEVRLEIELEAAFGAIRVERVR